jgi:hypothetical protein
MRRWRIDLDRLIGIRQRILLSAHNDNGNNFGPSLRRDETLASGSHETKRTYCA